VGTDQGETIAAGADADLRARPRRRHPSVEPSSVVEQFDLGDLADGTRPGDEPFVDPSMPAMRFDDFELIRSIGRGGMGTVYLARDVVLDRRVAVKLLGEHARDPYVRERFEVEARALASIQHPNVVAAYRGGCVEGRPYLAQELVSGPRLDELRRPLPWPAVWRIGRGLARALAAAHARRVIHRDVKPANVMLGEHGEVKLIDFGLATVTGGGGADVGRARRRARRLTEDGTIIGTPKYIAPEIWDGVGASEQSDVHAMGLVLWELLAGFLPHGNLAGAELAEAARVLVLPPLLCATDRVPRAFAALVDRCVKRKPGERVQSAAEVAAMMDGVAIRPGAEDEDAVGSVVVALERGVEEMSAITAVTGRV
jgi:serine/threonine protein kinase